MSAPCNCAEHVKKFSQQISIMRKEIKNIRQLVDGANRAHRKHMTSLQSVLTNIGQDQVLMNKGPSHSAAETNISLEQGNIQTVPIGYISSCFAAKNGTPRQPTICSPSRATLRIQQSVFNNPSHPLVGLDHYSHIWVIFLFHKNGHLSYKAKVRPPRLNGQRVGVYSTRSPHRPNALGLTLAKLERVTGDTLHLSGIDMIAGTPVLDIKPYIPDYDCPHTRADTEECDVSAGELLAAFSEQPVDTTDLPSSPDTQGALAEELAPEPDHHHDPRGLAPQPNPRAGIAGRAPCSSGLDASGPSAQGRDLSRVLAEVTDYLHQGDHLTEEASVSRALGTECTSPQGDRITRLCYGEEAYSAIASWIREPPVSNLEVRFTPHAERELREFVSSDSTVLGKPRFRFLQGSEEAVAAIRGVLSADPRSVYRRTRCQDRLFYFTLDTADITCWFGDGFAEVLRVQPVRPSQLGSIDTTTAV